MRYLVQIDATFIWSLLTAPVFSRVTSMIPDPIFLGELLELSDIEIAACYLLGAWYGA